MTRASGLPRSKPPGLARDLLILAGLWLLGLVLDALWVHQHQLPPAWDQGDHLSRALGFLQVLETLRPLDPLWWHSLWDQSPSYRGPLTYLVSAPVLAWLGPGYGSAILSNGVFQGLLLLSLYGQGRLLGKPSAGLWAGLLTLVSPALLNQRLDYLIDFSLTAVITWCWYLLSVRVLADPKHPWLRSGLAGLSLGAVVLTRPTGLLLLWLPLLSLTLLALIRLFRGRWRPILELALAAAVAWLVAGGWFSQNWLTIVSTVNNARQWGVLYQQGLGPETLAGWLFYPRLLPSMAGAWLVGLVVTGWLLSCWQRRHWPALPAAPMQRWRLLWWLSFPLGGLLVASLMSTKEFRFVLPLLPQMLLLLGLLIRESGRWLQAAVMLLGFSGLLACQFGLGPNLTGFSTHAPRSGQRWPLEEIVASIRRQAPLQLSTLAVLPDSEFLNTFNLEAEGRRQNFRVAARQTVAPVEQLKQDLEGFDWFLLKGGDQGVMSDQRQARLGQMVRESAAFSASGSWPLPDGSRAELFRRRQLSLEVEPAPCPGGKTPTLEIWPGSDTLRLRGPTGELAGSRLLLDGHDHAVGQGMVRPLDRPGTERGSSCLVITERLASGKPAAIPAQARLLLADGAIRPMTVEVHSGNDPGSIQGAPPRMASRHQQLLALGELLRRGELDALFARVGWINQHDPEQGYLSDGEAILRARLHRDPHNLSLLYPLALAQALQRKADAAALSLSQITRLDPGNANAHLGLGFVQLYRFNPWAAQPALDQAAQLNPSNPTLRTLRAVAAAMRLDLTGAHTILSR
ncbi:MAG: hypothetical protein WCF98_10910 [Synechococcus sp. ELA057]